MNFDLKKQAAKVASFSLPCESFLQKHLFNIIKGKAMA